MVVYIAMKVQFDKEKRMKYAKSEEQKASDRTEAEPERVNAENEYVPMVAEPQEYQYNAGVFEARDVDGVKQEAQKVREDKARQL